MTKTAQVTIMTLALFGVGLAMARAQTASGALRDVERISVDIAQLDEDSDSCGVTRNRISASIQDMIAKAPFETGGDRYILLIRISSLPKDGECFSSVDMGVYYRGPVSLPGRPEGTGKTVLWENGTILISPRSQHWPEVENIMLHLMNGLIADWRGDNAGSG